MAPLFIGGAQLDGGDHLTVALHLVFGQDARMAVVGPVQGPWAGPLPYGAIQHRFGDAVEGRRFPIEMGTSIPQAPPSLHERCSLWRVEERGRAHVLRGW